MDPLDWVPMSERHFKLFGACEEAVVFLRQHDMFNKPAGEIRHFLLENGKTEWYQQWIDTRNTHETYEKIARRIMSNYIESKDYCVYNDTTKMVVKHNNLEDAMRTHEENKNKFLEEADRIGLFTFKGQIYDVVNGKPIDSLDEAKKIYMDFNKSLFYIVEEITTIHGDCATKRLDTT